MDALELLARYHAYAQVNNEWHSRIVKIDQLFAGEWELLWPGLSSDSLTGKTEPTVHNIPRQATEDFAREFAAQIPTVAVPEGTNRLTRGRSTKVRRRLLHLWDANHIRFCLRQWAQD